MEKDPIVVTGVGMITPLGRGVKPNWRRLLAGRCGLARPPEHALGEGLWLCGRVGEVPLPEKLPQALRKECKFLNRGAYLGLAAAWEAMVQAGLNPGERGGRKTGLCTASGDHGHADFAFLQACLERMGTGEAGSPVPRRRNQELLGGTPPFFLLQSMHNNLSSLLAAFLGITGWNAALADLSPSGALALDLACRALRRGPEQAAVVVGYASWVSPLLLHELRRLGLLSACRAGSRSCRPLERDRDGLIPGEGAAALVLEPLSRARQRQGPVLGTILASGHAATQAPAGSAAAAIQAALDEAGSDPRELGFVIAHGDATPEGDAAELEALRAFSATLRRRLPICALKGYTGHLGAASDLGEIVFGLLAARKGMIPGTLHFERGEPGFDHLAVSSSPQRVRRRCFLALSRGFTGQAAATLVHSY